MIIEEIVTEIQAEPYPYTTSVSRGGRSLTEFSAKFKTRDGSQVELLIITSGQTTYILFTRDESIKKTGTGDQFKILLTILSIIQSHLSELVTESNKVTFSADLSEPSRVKLYKNRLSPIITSILGSEWDGPEIQNKFGEAIFVWLRQTPIEKIKHVNRRSHN